MATHARKTHPSVARFVSIGAILATFVATGAAFADPLGAGPGRIYRLGPRTTYQHGCFPPCLCPILERAGVMGTLKLVFVGTNDGMSVYEVADVNWFLPGDANDLRIVGGGRYSFGSPSPSGVLQHRMELDLRIGDEPAQNFDSGWGPIENMEGIHIAVSINGMYCLDTAFVIHADPVPPDQIRPYRLTRGSTFQRGCFDPCDCPLGPEMPMEGTLALVPLNQNLYSSDFAVVDVRWHVVSTSVGDAITIHGFGIYHMLGEFAITQRLVLDAVVGGDPPARFDSGWVVAMKGFPLIDILASMNYMECFDTVLHVVAEPDPGRVCGGIQGLPCEDGEFCKLPVGACCCDFEGVCQPIPDACPTVIDPVCGCDHQTYPNECEADRAGVIVAHYGPCEQQRCIDDSDCADSNAPDAFCKFPEGTCGDATVGGVCTPVPGACPRIYDPVCGCDGNTYPNECEADNARTSVAHRGPCEVQPCRTDGDCALAGTMDAFCKFPEGTCGDPAVEGVCTPVPGGCPLDYDPVCGCDGVTYPNECTADSARVSIAHRGPCEAQLCSERLGLPPCPDDMFCHFPEGTCDNGDVPGVCEPRPLDCPDVWDPVCGCDGNTYGNECDGYAAGVSIRHRGECGQFCGGWYGDTCSEGEFCKFPTGICSDAADHPGICTPIPDACPEIFDPVCGCDGQTYDNECFSDQARVSVLHHGPCEAPPCVTDSDCAVPGTAGAFCKFPEGTCGENAGGACAPIPDACPLVLDPVCGCDGVTYSNECEADRARVSVLHRGPCTAQRCSERLGLPPCPDDMFCQFPEGTCDNGDVPGVCEPRPVVCPDLWDPVCGCDGNTYGNECDAFAAGVSIRHRGTCGPQSCPATRVIGNGNPFYCPPEPVVVHMVLRPPPDTSSIGLEDRVPSSWDVVEISHEGVYDAVNEKVKWGPFFPPFPEEVHYVVVPGDAAIPPCFEGVISLDGINEPVCGPDCLQVLCAPFMEADLPQPECPACPGDCTMCVDDTCESRSIGMCEVTSYACAWKHGCNDDLAGMTRAAFVWRKGECYCWDPMRENWFPTDCPSPSSGVCGPRNGTASSISPMETQVASGGQPVGMQPSRMAGADRRGTYTVEVPIAMPDGIAAVAVKLHIPTGWSVVGVTDGGTWDARRRDIKWGPFVENLNRTVQFSIQRSMRQVDLTPDEATATRRGTFVGVISFDGANQPFEVEWSRRR